MSRTEWLEARRLSVGASEAAGVLGVSPWSSPWSIWAEKRGQGAVARDPETLRRMDWGTRMEPVILEEYHDRRGFGVRSYPQYEVIRHPKFPAIPMHATPDGEEIGVRLIEIKIAHTFASDWSEGPPLYYEIQTQHQMACTGHDAAVIVASIGGAPPEDFPIERNDRFIGELEVAITDFWQRYVVTGKPPSVDSHPATIAALELLHPDDSGETVELPAEAAEWDERLQGIKELVKTLTGERKGIENNIKAALGAATFGTILGQEGRYKWATQERKAHEVKASKFRKLNRLKR